MAPAIVSPSGSVPLPVPPKPIPAPSPSKTAQSRTSASASGPKLPAFTSREIEVNAIAFHISQIPNNASAGVIFSQVDSSTITNCTFFSADTGIEDYQSQGGNSYSNNTFVGTGEMLTIGGQNNGVPTTLANCRFGGPAN